MQDLILWLELQWQKKNKKPKLISVKYYVLNGWSKILVCKHGFLLYNVQKGAECLKTSLKLNKSPHDSQGENTSGNAIPGVAVNEVECISNHFLQNKYMIHQKKLTTLIQDC